VTGAPDPEHISASDVERRNLTMRMSMPLRAGTGANMEQITVAALVLVVLAAKALAILTLAYVGARLAIRHERRASQTDPYPQIGNA